MSNPEGPDQIRTPVSLSITGRIKRTMATAFHNGMFRPSMQAVLELTDNVANFRDRSGETTTQIFVSLHDQLLSVLGTNEQGMDAHGIGEMLKAGQTSETGTSIGGVGVKIAAWALAYGFRATAKKPGEVYEHEFQESDFGDPAVEYTGTRSVISRSVPDREKHVGRVEIALSNLKPKGSDLPQRAEAIQVIGQVYRPLLTSKDVKYDRVGSPKIGTRKGVNEEGKIVDVSDGMVAWVTMGAKRTVQIKPQAIELKSGSENLSVAWTVNREPIGFWIGEKDPEKPGMGQIKPGIKIYYDGRLVRDRENLGVIDFKDTRTVNVVGEAHLDHVKGIKDSFSMNKSEGFTNESEAWQRAKDALHLAALPFIRSILERPIEPNPTMVAGLQDVLNGARRIADVVMREISDSDPLMAEVLALGSLGTNRGQIHSRKEESEVDLGAVSPKSADISGKDWPKQDGKTFPTADADPAIKRIRRGLVHAIEIESFEPGDNRLSTIVVDDTGQSKRRILKINSVHPAFQQGIKSQEVNARRSKWELKRLIAYQLIHHASVEGCGRDIDKFERDYARAKFAVDKMLFEDPEFSTLIALEKQQLEKNATKK